MSGSATRIDRSSGSVEMHYQLTKSVALWRTRRKAGLQAGPEPHRGSVGAAVSTPPWRSRGKRSGRAAARRLSGQAPESTDAISSAVSWNSTDKLHERILHRTR